MKKLKLDLDQIQVATFAPETAERGRGTVNANSTDTYASTIFACGGSGESCESCFPNYCPRMPGEG